MTARQYDTNGWYEIVDNPISRVGVFDYLGSQLPFPDLDPKAIYRVYRPEEELSDPACLESFRLLPWVNEHTLLGAEEISAIPAEKKGVHGVIGERVRYAPDPQGIGGMILANIKVWSDGLANLIKSGKRELSCGYRCVYERAAGIWNGQRYDFIQRQIRGNHLATVGAGRMGPDVAVLDHLTFTCDAKDFTMADEKNDDKGEGAVTLEGVAAEVKAAIGKIAELAKIVEEAKAAVGGGAAEETVEEVTDEDTTATITTDEEKAKAEAMDAAIAAVKKLGKPGAAMDAAVAAVRKIGTLKTGAAFDAALKQVGEKIAAVQAAATKPEDVLKQIGERDELAKRLTPVVGAFDHAAMTADQVAEYGIKKLGIKCAAGAERATLDGYLLANANNPSNRVGLGLDAAPKSKALEQYLAESN